MKKITIGMFKAMRLCTRYQKIAERERSELRNTRLRQMAVTSALLHLDKIVEELNAFQPSMLGGYPFNLELLIEKQQSGQLHISPVLIMTGGEYLSAELRDKLAKAFDCYVQTSYACTPCNLRYIKRSTGNTKVSVRYSFGFLCRVEAGTS